MSVLTAIITLLTTLLSVLTGQSPVAVRKPVLPPVSSPAPIPGLIIPKPEKNISRPLPSPAVSADPAGPDYGPWRYPGAVQVGESVSGLSFTSNDRADAVTDWYKQKITALNMNVKTFIQTKANGKVMNKLVGADSRQNISVAISQKEAAAPVTIGISITKASGGGASVNI